MLRALHDFLFPPLCLYCNALHQERAHFCPTCQELFEFISLHGRCRRCFRPISGRGPCRYCRKNSPITHRSLTLFEPFGPPMALAQDLESHAKSLGALIAMRLSQISWPIPSYALSSPALAPILTTLTRWYAPWLRPPSLKAPPAGSSLLFLTLHPSIEELPTPLIPNRIYHLSLLSFE